MREAIVTEVRTAAKWMMVGIVVSAVIEIVVRLIAGWPV
jgi:hypothetical protein